VSGSAAAARRLRLVALAIAGALGCDETPAAVPASEAPAPAAVAPAEPTAFDLNGAPVDPFAGDAKAIALVFLGRDCPISNRYAPELARIREGFGTDVAWFLVFPDPDDEAAAIERHLAEYGLRGPAIRDPLHVLVEKSAVHVTPESAVFVRDGGGVKRVYAGRIDDRWVDYGRARPAARTHELADAITAALAGIAPKASDVPGVGCPIDDLLPS
jgi:hypothetical protein